MPDTRASLARTPLHHWHAAHGARFIERDGWQVVAAYSGADGKAVTGLGLSDVSAFAKISLRGPQVASFVPTARGVVALPEGKGLACRLTDDHLLLLASTPAASVLADRIVGLREGRAVVQTDATSAYAGFELRGPRLDELLRRLTDLDVRPTAFPASTCAETALAGVEALLVRPDERSLRVYLAWDLGEYVWERMLDAGRDRSITPMGQEALGHLR